MYHEVSRGNRPGLGGGGSEAQRRIVLLIRYGVVRVWAAIGTSEWCGWNRMEGGGGGDEVESLGIGGTCVMEPGSVSGSTRVRTWSGDGREPDVNHMRWYHLRTSVARMIPIVW